MNNKSRDLECLYKTEMLMNTHILYVQQILVEDSEDLLKNKVIATLKGSVCFCCCCCCCCFLFKSRSNPIVLNFLFLFSSTDSKKRVTFK